MATTPDKYAALSEMMRAAQSGDQASYARFLRAVAPMLRRVIGRKLPAPDVEDVLQEILLSIHKARHTYDGTRPLMPWLMAIAQFRINDALRRAYARSRHGWTDIDSLAETLADTSQQEREQDAAQDLLQQVPPREQQILTMMHVEGYTARETGARLGMKESAVKVAAHRAMRKLREKFSA